MISPAKLDKLPSDMVNLVQELQEEIIRDVCRRFSKANYLTPTAEWQLYKANQLQLSYNEVNRRIARFLKVRERDVQRLYTDTVRQALKEDGDIYRIAAAMGKLPSDTGDKINSYFRSAGFSRLLSKGLKNCKNGVRNLCNSMAAQVNRDLSDAMDYAHIQVLSGAFSPQEAIYRATKRLIEGGLTRVEYPSGRRNNVDVCVRRAVRSSVNKSCCDLQLDLARELGSKYVEVTSYFGARPSHAEWQGQVFCLEKGDPTYPYFYEVTGYGTGEGLAGWNCGHSFSPFFPGIDTPSQSPNFSKEENNEYYALTQRQRALERAVRKSKQELAALDGARSGTDDPQVRSKLDIDFTRKSVTLKQREKRLDNFIKANELAADNSRVRVVGFGKSVSRKAVWAAKNKIPTVTLHSDLYRNTEFKPLDYFDSKEYKDKFNRFGSDFFSIWARDSIRNAAQEAIKNNYGKMSEDVFVIRNFTGIIYDRQHNDDITISIDPPIGKSDSFTVIHNHPNNSPISLADIVTTSDCKSIRTMMAVGHDGKIYWLQIGNGKRLDVTSQMLEDKNNMEAQALINEWARDISARNGDFFLALLSWADKYNWKAGVI